MPTINDINLKQFYIYDSLKNDTISDNMKPIDSSSFSTYANAIGINSNSTDSTKIGFSYITTNPSNATNIIVGSSTIVAYDVKGPFNLFELNSELSNRYNKLIAALDILQRCDRITKYIISNNQSVTHANNGYFYPTTAQANDLTYIKFSNDLSGCSAFKSESIINHDGSTETTPSTQSGKIFNASMYVSSASAKTAPDIGVANSNTQIISYPQFANPHKEFDNKDIGQMVGDIKNLMQNYSMILKYYSTTPLDTTIVSTGNKDYDMTRLQQIQSANVQLRQELEQKVQFILAGKDTIKNAHNEAKYYMDSTVYANIMWSILATTLIYFVLVKI